MCSSISSEKFYLCKGGSSDVYISEGFAQRLKPFQRDGIRFLYRQFVKKKPGAILNDPPGCGKTVQVVLLLNAVRLVLQPLASLIVCSEANLPHWKHHFDLWTDCAEDIQVNTEKLFSKKDIFISSVDNVTSASRRDWGIVVADDLNTGNHLKQMKLLNAKFKIWLTGDSVVEHLQTLSSIYGWINPKEKFDMNAYNSVGLFGKDRAERDIALGVFCEDLLIRRIDAVLTHVNDKDYNEKYENYKKNNYSLKEPLLFSTSINNKNNNDAALHDETKKNTEINPDVKRKNKDSTGLKIKRTKHPSQADKSAGKQNVKANYLNGDNNFNNDEVINKKVKLYQTHAADKKEDAVCTSIVEIQNEFITKIQGDFESDKMQEIRNLQDNAIKNNHELLNKSIINESIILEDNISSHVDVIDKDVNKRCSNGMETGNEEMKFTLGDILLPNSKGKDVKANLETNTKHVAAAKCNKVMDCVGSNNIKSTVKQIEELAIKQFRGSLLDTLF